MGHYIIIDFPLQLEEALPKEPQFEFTGKTLRALLRIQMKVKKTTSYYKLQPSL